MATVCTWASTSTLSRSGRVGADDGYLVVLQVDHLVGVLHERGGVAAYEVFALPDAYDERTAAARHEQRAGVAAVYQGNGVCAHYLVQSQLQGSEQVDVVGALQVVHQLYQHFGVRAAAEGDAFLLQPLLDDGIVLDDAIVHQGKVARGGHMRMCIGLRGLAVGGPAGVGYADVACAVFVGGILLQPGHFACSLVHVQPSFGVDEGDACTVVASVFQSFQSFNQDGISLPLADVSYYSTHNVVVFIGC